MTLETFDQSDEDTLPDQPKDTDDKDKGKDAHLTSKREKIILCNSSRAKISTVIVYCDSFPPQLSIKALWL